MRCVKSPSQVDWLYVDFNSFFASVEQELNPFLRNKPVGVVPMLANNTCCIAASYEAKAHGVKTGTRVSDARKMCPDIHFVVADHKKYVEFHHKLIDCIEKCIPVQMIASIDEIAATLMGKEREVENAKKIALTIKKQIFENVGEHLGSSIGLAPNRYLAKVAADMQKPNGLTVLTLEDIPQKLYSLKIEDFPGVGRKMKIRLEAANIYSVESLYAQSKTRLRQVWGGVLGEYMHDWIRGEELSLGETKRSSISHSHVLPPEQRSHEGAEAVLRKLLHKAGTRLRKISYWTQHLGIKVKFMDGSRWIEETSFIECQDDLTLLEAFENIFKNYLKDKRKPIQVGLWLSKLVPDSMHSFSFFENPKSQSLSHCLDKINDKYGKNSIYFGGFHSSKESAPTRIAFTNIPKIDQDF